VHQLLMQVRAIVAPAATDASELLTYSRVPQLIRGRAGYMVRKPRSQFKYSTIDASGGDPRSLAALRANSSSYIGSSSALRSRVTRVSHSRTRQLVVHASALRTINSLSSSSPNRAAEAHVTCVALRDSISDLRVALPAAAAATNTLVETLIMFKDDASIVEVACQGLCAAVARGPDEATALISAAPLAVSTLLAMLRTPPEGAPFCHQAAARCALAALVATDAGAGAVASAPAEQMTAIAEELCSGIAAASPSSSGGDSKHNAVETAGRELAALAALAALSAHTSVHSTLLSTGVFAALIGVLSRACAVPHAFRDYSNVMYAATLVANALLDDEALSAFVFARGVAMLCKLFEDCVESADISPSAHSNVAVAAHLCEALCTVCVSKSGADAAFAANVLSPLLHVLDGRVGDASNATTLGESAAWTLRNLCRDAAVAKACAKWLPGGDFPALD
jgi:hypothetical protein